MSVNTPSIERKPSKLIV